MLRLKGLRPLGGLIFEDAVTSGSGVTTSLSAPPTLSSLGLHNPVPTGQAPGTPALHQTAAPSADVICLTDNDQDAPSGSGTMRQSAAQPSQAQTHPRPRKVPVQSKASLSEPSSSRYCTSRSLCPCDTFGAVLIENLPCPCPHIHTSPATPLGR